MNQQDIRPVYNPEPAPTGFHCEADLGPQTDVQRKRGYQCEAWATVCYIIDPECPDDHTYMCDEHSPEPHEFIKVDVNDSEEIE